MQNKLHTTPCHPQSSLRAKSRSQHLISKLTHFQISKLLILLLFPLWGLGGYAQQYNWDWAVSGGSPNDNESSSTGMNNLSEQIYDVKIGSDGNYYFIATMKGLNLTQLDGEPVTAYNSSLGGNDIFIFSTDCEGQVRWYQAIGGHSNDRAFNLALDSNNNVYVGANVRGGSTYSLHFSQNSADDVTPYPANPEAYKRTYILKYDNNGNFEWKKALQGSVTQTNWEAYIHDIAMDSQNKLHFIVGFANGTHLDGLVTVPSTFTNYTYQYYLVKFNTATQQFDDVLLLPMTGQLEQEGKMRFAYDENSNIYYLAGMQAGDISAPPTPLSYGGDAFVERSFILAFNGIGSTTGIDGGEAWRREIYSDPHPSFGDVIQNYITSLVIDANSDVYIAGTFYTYDSQNLLPIKVYDPSDSQVTPYIFTPGIYSKIPTLIKFSYNNNEVSVQWAKTPTAYASNFTTSGSRHDKGLAVRGNEIAFGANTGYFIWDNFVQNPVQFSQVDPSLMRFDTQTGNTVGMHTIESPKDYSGYITAVAVDNDGNYVTGGAFQAVLFTNNANVNQLVSSGGNDFFVAKLAASVCGTPVSTQKFNTLNVNVYPNPTTGIINIETQETLFNYMVYDINGREIQKGMFSSNNQVNLQNANSGVYFVKVTTVQGSTATVKVIKK